MKAEDWNIKEFLEKGFVKLSIKIPEGLTERAVLEVMGHYRYGQADYNLNNRVENAWMFSGAVREIASNSGILDFLGKVFGGPAFPFQTLNFEKGSQQRFHSDFYHFSSINFENMAGVWVALEDIHEDSGPLVVLPESHKLPYLFPEDIGLTPGRSGDPYEQYPRYEDEIQKIIDRKGLESQLVTLNKGDVLVWHSNLLHGGAKVIDPRRSRLSQVTHYFKAKELYFSPIQSGKSVFSRRYRLPYNVINGRRAFPFLG